MESQGHARFLNLSRANRGWPCLSGRLFLPKIMITVHENLSVTLLHKKIQNRRYCSLKIRFIASMGLENGSGFNDSNRWPTRYIAMAKAGNGKQTRA